MKNKKRAKIATLLLSAVMLTTAFSFPVSAAETTSGSIEDALIVDNAGSEGESTLLPSDRLSLVSAENKGSISITLSDGKGEGTSKEGVEFSCLKIADIEKGEYVLADEYENLGIDINDLQNSSDLEAAATKIAEVAGNGTLITTDMNGKLTFSDLDVGVYLIEASNDEKYDDVTPLLISIPTWNEDDGEMDYEVNVNPKHTPKPVEEETPKEDCQQTKPCPQTGIDSYTWLYFGGAAAIVVVLIVVNTVSKKKRA